MQEENTALRGGIMMFKIRCFSIFFILLYCFSSAALAGDDMEFPLSKIKERATAKYIQDTTKKIFHYFKDTTIKADSALDGNVVIEKGNLTIKGHVTGDVLAIFGNVFIKSGSQIDGNVTSVNGRIRQEERSFVFGNQIETKAKNLFSYFDWGSSYYSQQGTEGSSHYYQGSYGTLPFGSSGKSMIVKYNRVQGLFLGMVIPKKVIGKYDRLNIHGFGGYGFREKKWNYKLGLAHWLFSQKDFRFELGADVYDFTDTKDTWYISSIENSLAAVLLHEDYQDFYRRSGYTFHASQNLTVYLQGTLAYSNDEYESVEKNADWALFGGKKKFQENPAIDEGNMRSLYGEIYLDTRNNHKRPSAGWYAKLGLETSNSKLKSDFSFNQYIFELRRYQPIGYKNRLDLRIKTATSEGDVPLQKLYQLGGVSTLRAFRNKALRGKPGAYGGDRMLLANLEYFASPKILGRDFLFIDDVRYILFFDAGNVWQRENVTNENSWSAGFSHLKLNSLKSDLGMAISSWSGKFRMSLAKRLHTNYKPLMFTVRLTKPF